MLQRSPGYFVSVPKQETIDASIRRWLPWAWAFWLLHVRHLFKFHLFYYLCRFFPQWARRKLRSDVAKVLPADTSLDPHFAPSYLPWEKRVCVVPDGDFFQALRSGKASVITDEIDNVTPNGIRLRSGRELHADIIITATGFKLQFLGRCVLAVDGRPIEIGNTFLWRGAMLQNVPNLTLLFGYTDASWTLGSDASARLFVRVMQEAKRRGATTFVPTLAQKEQEHMGTRPLWTMKSTHVQSALATNALPKCGDLVAWQPRRGYFIDSWFASHGNISTGMVFD